MAAANPAFDIICIVGPKQSGKTFLLKSWQVSFHTGVHGCESFGVRRIQSITEAEAKDRLPAPDAAFIQPARDPIIDLEEYLKDRGETRITSSEYFIIHRESGGAGNPLAVKLIDAPGEILFPEGGAVDETQKKLLIEGLNHASKVIFVLPMVQFGDNARIMIQVRTLLAGLLAAATGSKLKTLVLAFTHCERRFVNYGNRAFLRAANPHELKRELQSHFDALPWAEDVRAFARMRGRRVILSASGSLGFVAGNGSVNIDPHRYLSRDPEEVDRLLADNKGRERDIKLEALKYEEWYFGADSDRLVEKRPFLSADPFLCAMIDRPSAYCIELPGGGEGRVPEEIGWFSRQFARLKTEVRKVIFTQD